MHVCLNSTEKVADTSTSNSVTENQPYLRNGKVNELRTWDTDGLRQGVLEASASARGGLETVF